MVQTFMSVFNLLQEIRDYELLACRANENFSSIFTVMKRGGGGVLPL